MDFLCAKLDLMVIAILADEEFRKKIAFSPLGKHAELENAEIIWADSVRALTIIDADAYLDLAFDIDPERMSRLQQILPKPLMVYLGRHTLQEIGRPFIRIINLPALNKRNRVKIVPCNPLQEKMIKSVFDALGWKYQLCNDTPTGK